jgi:uncharacterized membrane protein
VRQLITRRGAEILIGISTALYAVIGIVSHFSLRTNAFDLSIFDYALWNSLNGRTGWVPFVGHSIFSEHFMPILLVTLPAYTLWQSPVTLIVIQVLSVGIAALALLKLARLERINQLVACVLILVFLVSRPSFLAINSYFYPEAFQPALVFALVLTWRLDLMRLYWVCLTLLLMTKEDASIYVATFGAIQYFSGRGRTLRTHSLLTIAIAIAWFALALAVAIPVSRSIDGLPDANHFVTARYAAADGHIRISELTARLFSVQTTITAIALLATFGLLPLGAPEWLGVVVPGFLLNIVARPDTLQAAFAGHYYWALLPWLAIAAIHGARRLERILPRFSVAVVAVLGVVTAASSPMLRVRHFVLDAAAGQTRAQLPNTVGFAVLAQPNLIPHLPHDNRIAALGRQRGPSDRHDFVLLTTSGDMWPFSRSEVAELARKYAMEPTLNPVSSGPLYAFRRTAPRQAP